MTQKLGFAPQITLYYCFLHILHNSYLLSPFKVLVVFSWMIYEILQVFSQVLIRKEGVCVDIGSWWGVFLIPR